MGRVVESPRYFWTTRMATENDREEDNDNDDEDDVQEEVETMS